MTFPTLSSSRPSSPPLTNGYNIGEDQFPLEFTSNIGLARQCFEKSNTREAAEKGLKYINLAFSVTQFAIKHGVMRTRKDPTEALDTNYYPFTSPDSADSHHKFSRLTEINFRRSLASSLIPLDPTTCTILLALGQDSTKDKSIVNSEEYTDLLRQHPELTTNFIDELKKASAYNEFVAKFYSIYFDPDSDNGAFNEKRINALDSVYKDMHLTCYKTHLSRPPFLN